MKKLPTFNPLLEDMLKDQRCYHIYDAMSKPAKPLKTLEQRTELPLPPLAQNSTYTKQEIPKTTKWQPEHSVMAMCAIIAVFLLTIGYFSFSGITNNKPKNNYRNSGQTAVISNSSTANSSSQNVTPCEGGVCTLPDYKWPVNNRRVSSGYGWRTFGGQRQFHKAIDISASHGDPIHPISSGTVLRTGYSGNAGNRVLVQHDDGKTSMYAHLSQISVSPGERVSTSSTIGNIGSTGRSTGPHLHLEITENGNKVDPMKYLR